MQKCTTLEKETTYRFGHLFYLLVSLTTISSDNVYKKNTYILLILLLLWIEEHYIIFGFR